jgi:pectin methylesterase-like acyl-CoA thioesterase
MSTGFVDAALITGAMAIPVGEMAVVEDANGYYVLERFDILEDPADFTTLQPSLIGTLKSEEFNVLVASWASGLEFEVNQAALDAYKPEKLELE